MTLFVIFCMLLAVYAMLIWVCLYHFIRIPRYVAAEKSFVYVSVVIAARNEEATIAACIESLLQQHYPKGKIEIVVVDDQSTDNTSNIIAQYAEQGVRLIRVERNDLAYGKKAAIAKGIAASVGELIMVTDADCVMGEKWVHTMVQFYQEKGSVFIAAPVKFHKPVTFLDLFQSLDFISLQGITAAGVHSGMLNMCNGANLAYTKTAFESVGGFEGIDQIPTGDDMLLMEKMSAAFPGKVHYCLSEDAIVETGPAEGLRAFIHQRIRWASKSTAYSSYIMKATLLLVYVVNAGCVAMMIASIVQPSYFIAWMLCWIVKTVIEIPFMLKVAQFYKSSSLIWWFPFMQPFHAVYTVAAGGFGWAGKYRWKGRNVERTDS